MVIDKTLTIEQDGKSREVAVEEALQHKTYQNAIAGDRSARREVLKMIEKRDVYSNARKGKNRIPPVGIKYESSDPTNADEALLILGIADPQPRPHGIQSRSRTAAARTLGRTGSAQPTPWRQ